MRKKKSGSIRRTDNYRRRVIEYGWKHTTFWVDHRVHDTAKNKARQLEMPIQIVLQTAIEVGLRRMTTSEIVACHQRWRAHVKPFKDVSFKPGHIPNRWKKETAA